MEENDFMVLVFSFIGSFIGTSIMVFITARIFYILGRKDERELNKYEK